MDDDDVYGPVVASYSRAEAFAEGRFIAIPAAAASVAGIGMPLIITADARREFVAGNDGGEDGRLLAVLSAVARAVQQEQDPNEVCFVVRAEELPSGQSPTGADRLIAITDPGDTGDPVMTLMLDHEM